MESGPLKSDGGRDNGVDHERTYRSYELDDSDMVSETVIRAVAAITDRSPLELDPLYDTIDPDALDSLFHCTGLKQPTTAKVTFRYEGCEFVVTSDHLYVKECDVDEPDAE